jgi:uncharacterized protein (TIGR03546 family)
MNPLKNHSRDSSVSSLFRRFWKSLLELFQEHRSPRKVAAGIAVGVWIGISPFCGLHTLLALFLSFMCRLNTPAVLLGTMISNPWFAPFLILMSLQIGCFILGTPDILLSLQEIRHFLSNPTWEGLYQQILIPYVLGSLLLGTVLALLAFWLTLWMATHRNTASSSSQ